MRSTISHFALVLFLSAISTFGQAPEVIGRIEGEAFTARGQVSIAQDGGRSVTTLLSGSEVAVASGHARLTLAEGGEIDICGPAQLSLLKSGGAITLALSYGRVHVRVSAELPLQIYTAMVTASPVSVGGKPRDAVIGLDAGGEMCVYAAHGAVRLENQFSGQRVLVPQLGEVSVPGGQIESVREATGGCRCEIPIAKKESPELPKAPDPAAPVRAHVQEKRDALKKEEGPVFTAVMPPLTFSAESPAPPPLPRPQMIQLIRGVRLQPTVYSGRVERAGQARQSPQQTATAASEQAQPEAVKVGFGTRFKNFFRRLFGRRS